MKICIFGAGAIGSYLAARFLNGGEHKISVVARGEHLAAMRTSGLRLQGPNECFHVHPHAAVEHPRDLPSQDIVFVTLKAPSLLAPAEI